MYNRIRKASHFVQCVITEVKTMNKTAKKNIIVLLATLIFTLAFATTCFAKSIPTTTVKPTTKAPTTVKPTKKDETTKKKQKTTKKDETTTGSGSGNGRYNGRSGNATNDVYPNNPNSKTGKRNSSGISPKTGSNIIIPIAGLLVAAGAIVVSRKELTDKN